MPKHSFHCGLHTGLKGKIAKIATIFALLGSSAAWGQQSGNTVSLRLDKTGRGIVTAMMVTKSDEFIWGHCGGRHLRDDGEGGIVGEGGVYECPHTLEFPKGARISITAGPEEYRGYRFSSWGGACAGIDASTCVITLDADTSVAANFTAKPASAYTLEVNVTGGFYYEEGEFHVVKGTVTDSLGAINCYPDCTATYNAGTRVTLTAHPNANAYFFAWTGDTNCPASNTCTVIMDGYKSIQAVFKRTGDNGGGDDNGGDDNGGGGDDQCMARHFTDAEKKIMDVFIAYYGRPADVGGLSDWVAELNNRGGDMNYIMRYFGNAPEYINRFGSLNNSELVDNLFEQLYARTADPKGYDFYTGELNAKRRTLASIALTILNATHKGGRDEVVLNNRRKAAQHYVTAAETWGGGLTEQTLANVLAQVTDSDASVNAACKGFSDALTDLR